MVMKIVITANSAFVFTPYNADFVAAIKKISGSKFMRDLGAWRVHAKSVESVRYIMRKVYGEDDLNPAEKIDIKITFEEDYESGIHKGITMFGKQIGYANGRDASGKLGDGVDLLEGNIHGTGSRQYYNTMIDCGTVLILHDVVEESFDPDKYADDGVVAEVLGKSADSHQILLDEKKRLEKRLAEVNEELDKS